MSSLQARRAVSQDGVRLVSLPRFELGASGVVLQCTKHYTNHAITILGSVVRRPDSAIHWIAILSTFVKLAVDGYSLRLRFGIYKLKLLGSIVGSRSVVSQLFG